MIIVRSVAGMQRVAKRWRRAGFAVCLVPTMGYLHEGHLSLVRKARRLVGARGKVVVSIYVNPTQFGPREDFGRYPRDLVRDRVLCREAGVDLLFVPEDSAMYLGGEQEAHSTYVVEERLSRHMEGRSRPTHFRGVTTIVAKLFNLVLPDVAVFGAKDYQQAAVIRRMVRDLNFPVRVVVAPTVREEDGLAMSSRNAYLKGSLRQQAVALVQAIGWVRARVRAAQRSESADGLRRQMIRQMESGSGTRVDYIEFFDPDSLEPVKQVQRGTHVALAVYVGKTRLIDNGRI